MKNNAYLWLIGLIVGGLILFALPFCSAQIYRQGTIVDLKVPCTNNGTYCSTSATCNTTIISPEGILTVNNGIMTQDNAIFNYTLSATQTAENGEYEFNVCCIDGDVTACKSLPFSITPNGKEITEGGATYYLVFLFLIFSFVAGCIYGAIKSKKPYAVMFYFLFGWLLLIIFFYVAWVGGESYLYSISFVGVFFRWMFYIMLFATFPMFLLVIVYSIWTLIMNKAMKRMLERGIPYDEAYSRTIARDLRKMRRGGKYNG
jgi:hypothetical protein